MIRNSDTPIVICEFVWCFSWHGLSIGHYKNCEIAVGTV